MRIARLNASVFGWAVQICCGADQGKSEDIEELREGRTQPVKHKPWRPLANPSALA